MLKKNFSTQAICGATVKVLLASFCIHRTIFVCVLPNNITLPSPLKKKTCLINRISSFSLENKEKKACRSLTFIWVFCPLETTLNFVEEGHDWWQKEKNYKVIDLLTHPHSWIFFLFLSFIWGGGGVKIWIMTVFIAIPIPPGKRERTTFSVPWPVFHYWNLARELASFAFVAWNSKWLGTAKFASPQHCSLIEGEYNYQVAMVKWQQPGGRHNCKTMTRHSALFSISPSAGRRNKKTKFSSVLFFAPGMSIILTKHLYVKKNREGLTVYGVTHEMILKCPWILFIWID